MLTIWHKKIKIFKNIFLKQKSVFFNTTAIFLNILQKYRNLKIICYLVLKWITLTIFEIICIFQTLQHKRMCVQSQTVAIKKENYHIFVSLFCACFLFKTIKKEILQISYEKMGLCFQRTQKNKKMIHQKIKHNISSFKENTQLLSCI